MFKTEEDLIDEVLLKLTLPYSDLYLGALITRVPNLNQETVSKFEHYLNRTNCVSLCDTEGRLAYLFTLEDAQFKDMIRADGKSILEVLLLLGLLRNHCKEEINIICQLLLEIYRVTGEDLTNLLASDLELSIRAELHNTKASSLIKVITHNFRTEDPKIMSGFVF